MPQLHQLISTGIKFGISYAIPGTIIGTWLLWPTYSNEWKNTLLLKNVFNNK